MKRVFALLLMVLSVGCKPKSPSIPTAEVVACNGKVTLQLPEGWTKHDGEDGQEKYFNPKDHRAALLISSGTKDVTKGAMSRRDAMKIMANAAGGEQMSTDNGYDAIRLPLTVGDTDQADPDSHAWYIVNEQGGKETSVTCTLLASDGGKKDSSEVLEALRLAVQGIHIR